MTTRLCHNRIRQLIKPGWLHQPRGKRNHRHPSDEYRPRSRALALVGAEARKPLGRSGKSVTTLGVSSIVNPSTDTVTFC